MNIGIIGYGRMGKMLAEKFSSSGLSEMENIFVSNRSKDKLKSVKEGISVCENNLHLAEKSDIIFICVRPSDIKNILAEINPSIKTDALLVSLNGSITFEMLEKISRRKIAKVIPSITAEINRSQTLVAYNDFVSDDDKRILENILSCMGNVIVLGENDIAMGSELVSCMPGFIASIF